jgi:hypothetical protein
MTPMDTRSGAPHVTASFRVAAASLSHGGVAAAQGRTPLLE